MKIFKKEIDLLGTLLKYRIHRLGVKIGDRQDTIQCNLDFIKEAEDMIADSKKRIEECKSEISDLKKTISIIEKIL